MNQYVQTLQAVVSLAIAEAGPRILLCLILYLCFGFYDLSVRRRGPLPYFCESVLMVVILFSLFQYAYAQFIQEVSLTGFITMVVMAIVAVVWQCLPGVMRGLNDRPAIRLGRNSRLF